MQEGLIELYARRYALAATAFDDMLSISPVHLVAQSLAAALHPYAGRLDEGLQAYRALAGDATAARRSLAELARRFAAGTAPPYQLDMVHARLGDAGGALQWLARAAEVHDFNLVCAGVDPAFDSLRPMPTFGERLAAWGVAGEAVAPPIMPA